MSHRYRWPHRTWNGDPSGPHTVRAIVDHVLVTGTLFGVVGTTSQLTATAYDARGNVISGVPVSWRSALPNIASVSAVGLVSFLQAGAVPITATVDARDYAVTVTQPDEPTFATTAFGASLKYINSPSFNFTSAIGGDGKVRGTQLQDARGGTFGQTYTPTTSNNGPEVSGSGTSLELLSSNASDMRTPAVAGDAVGPVTYAFFGRYSRTAPGGLSFPWGLSDDGITTALLLAQDDGAAEKGGYEILSNPSALTTHASIPRDGRPRLVIFTIDATGLVKVCSPGSAAAPGPIYSRQLTGAQIPTATAVRRWFGGVPGFPAISTEAYRGDVALNRLADLTANSTDLQNFISLGGYHGAINGSKVRLYTLGTSLDIGYNNVSGGAVDLSQNWPTLMLQGSSFNGKNPHFPLNFAVTGATIRPGTNAGNNAFDVQLPLLQQHYDPTASVCIVTVSFGTNDMASNLIGTGFTDSGNSTLADVRSLCASIRALGSNIRIVVVPCIPRNASGGPGGQVRFDPDRDTFNSGMAATWPTFADAYAGELLTIAPFNTDNGYTDSIFFDGIHISPYTKMAQGISPAVLRVSA